jgi:hypothetical protein
VIHSVIGQNERWAQIAALQPPPGAQAAQATGSGFSNLGTTAPDPSVVNPISSGSGSALSNDTNFLLFFLNQGTAAANGTANGAPSGTPSGTPSGIGSPTQTTGAPDDTSQAGGATSLEAQLLTDVGSYLSTLTGGGGLAASSSSGAGTPTATSTLAQDIDAITSAVGTVAFASAGGLAPGSNDGNDVGNTGSASAGPSWRDGWDGERGSGDAFRQQFGLAAYSASDQAGQTNTTASALQAITV